MKKRYVVNFLKTVSDDYGQDREILQHAVEVFAADRGAAVEQAKAELCRTENLSHWTQHADRFEVIEPEFPS
jgi:hypothetical protein